MEAFSHFSSFMGKHGIYKQHCQIKDTFLDTKRPKHVLVSKEKLHHHNTTVEMNGIFSPEILLLWLLPAPSMWVPPEINKNTTFKMFKAMSKHFHCLNLNMKWYSIVIYMLYCLLKSDISFSKILQSTTENTRQAGSSEMTQRICSTAFFKILFEVSI